MSKSKIFTLIELLMVIVIIGILAVTLIPRLIGAQARARDTARKTDLRQVQTALELYYSENSKYPIANGVTGRRGNCMTFGSYGTSGDQGRIPNLAPNYISQLPLDPKLKEPNGCYIYRSPTSEDYMLQAYLTVETKVSSEYVRASNPNQNSIVVFSEGARN